MRIPNLVIENYYDDICFMVDANFIYAHAILTRVAWIRSMQYDINVDEVTIVVIALLFEEIDMNVEPFSTYETIKIKIMMETKVPKIDRKTKKMIKDLEGKLGESQLR